MKRIKTNKKETPSAEGVFIICGFNDHRDVIF